MLVKINSQINDRQLESNEGGDGIELHFAFR